MADFARVTYTGDGSTRVFSIPFDYLQQADIHVFVDATEDLTFTFPTSGQIQTTGTPGSGAVVQIVRETSLIDRVVDWTDGSVLAATDLDESDLQMFFLAQETADLVTRTINTPLGHVNWSAQNKTIENLSNGVNPTDAVTLGQMTALTASAVASANASAASASASQIAAAASAVAAAASATAASGSATSASTSATTATTQATTATTQASAASTSATASAGSATAAATSATNAATSATTATTQATNAATSATTATTQATNSSNSATAAATSATNASNSATAAATSATNAATSETNAAASAVAAAASATSVNLRTINSQAAGYTVIAGDRNKLINYTGTGSTIAFTAAATLASGFEFEVRHSGASGNLVLDPNGAELINGAASITLTTGQAVVIVCTGTAFLVTQAYGFGATTGTVTNVATAGLATGGAITNTGTVTVTASSVSDVETGTGTTTANTPAALATIWMQGADIASAATLTIPTTGGGNFNVTGTTTITKLDKATIKTGRIVELKFNAALTLTNNASILLPGGANITTAAGDVARFRCEDATTSANIWRCVAYQKWSGLAVATTSIFNAPYQPSDQTITTAGSLTLAHGLGVKPLLCRFSLVCQTAELGYSIGDEYPFEFGSTGGALGGTMDATNLNLRFASTANAFSFNHKTTGVFTAATNASWKLRVRAYA